MLTDIGEYFVGACLSLQFNCGVVDYNVRPPGGGLDGLEEIDVVGLDFEGQRAYVCEVTTHIRGLLYKDNRTTVERIAKKHARQKRYAAQYLKTFRSEFMFWSPVVPRGYITSHLEQLEDLQLVINGEYKKRIEALSELAQNTTHDARNPVFRMLQIMGHMRE